MQDTKDNISQKNTLSDDLPENINDTREQDALEAGSAYSDSILVSVNAVRVHAAEEEPSDDEWLNHDDDYYECKADDVPDTSGNIENLSYSADNSDVSAELSDASDEIVDEVEAVSDVAENAAYDIEEFEDDDDPADSDRGKKLSAKKIGCISCSAVLVLLIILLVSVTFVFYHYYQLMEIDDDDSIYFDSKVTFSDTELSDIPDGNVEIEEGPIFKDKDVFNILLIGTDERTKGFSKNARADSIMLLSFDNKTKRTRLVSLERGMLVSIPGHKNDILTHTFRYGGSKLLMDTVRTHFKVDVDKYIRVNFSMFQKLVDEVGGVDITLTKQEAKGLNTYPNNNTWKLKRKVQPGVNHFNGYEALQYSRLRWIDDDFHRIERQRKVIIAIKENMTDLTISDLKDISEDCLPYVQTNLSAIEFADLLIKIPGYIDNDVMQMTIPQKGTYKTLGHVDFTENARILNNFLYGSTNSD